MAAVTEPIRFHSFRADSAAGDVLSAARADASIAQLLRVDPATGNTLVRAYGTGGTVLLQDAAGNAIPSAPHQHSAADLTSGTVNIARLPVDLSTRGVLGKGSSPAAGTAGRLWWNTALGYLQRDTGTAWESLPVSWAAIPDKPATFAPSAHSHPWSDVTGRPTTLAGYGIADAWTRTEADGRFSLATHVHDAFKTVANGAGAAQFSASGFGTIQFAAGSDLAVAFDAANRRVTFSYTGGSTGGVTAAFSTAAVGGSSFTAVGSDTLNFAAGAGLTAALDAPNKRITFALDNHSAALLTSGTLVSARLAGSYTGITGVGTLTAGTWNATVIGAAYGGTGVNASAAANGRLLIGNGAGFTLANLTAGSGISVTNGAGTITIAATDSAFAGTRAYRSSAFSIQSGTWTAIPWDAQTRNVGGWHSTSTNTTQIKPTKAGKVRVHAQCYLGTSALGTSRAIAIYKNGVVHAEWGILQNNAGAGTYVQVSDEVEVNGSTDYIEIYAFQDSGSSMGIVAATRQSFVTVSYIGA